MKEVLLFYSGGLDSKLSACYLVKEGYHVNLIHFDNGSIVGTKGMEQGAKKLEERFGSSHITYLGIVSTAGMAKRLHKIENRTFSDLIESYGNMTISQYQCLACRSAMYYYGAAIALEKDISYIAEGARKSQQFAIEQPPMRKAYESFLKKQGLTLLMPVYYLEDDLERKRELENFSVETVPYEDYCFLGYPLEETHPVGEETVEAITNLFQETMLPEMNQLLEKESEKNRIKHLTYYKKKVEWL